MGSADQPRQALVTRSLSLIDEALDETAVVFGSLPPDGRDLDLLVRESSHSRLGSALRAAGFVRHGRSYWLFNGCTAYAVDVVPADAWRLPHHAIDRLFREAIPLPGATHLARPAPSAVLLIAAKRRMYERDGRRWRGSIARALDEDARAWTSAKRSAAAWRVSFQLDMLRLIADHPRAATALRAAIAVRSALQSARSLTRRPRGMVIALSGLDGTGKSTQAASLEVVLGALGYRTTVVWKPIDRLPLLGPLSAWGRAAPRRKPTEPSSSRDQSAPRLTGHATLSTMWLAALATANGLSLAQSAIPHMLLGKIVIFDRYRLDTIVRFRARYGDVKAIPAYERILRRLTPAPSASIFLDTDPELIGGRKRVQYSIEEMRARAALYRTHYRRLGATRIDASQPVDVVCREVIGMIVSRMDATVRRGR